MKILALLVNFGEDREEVALQSILTGVQGSAKGDFAESRYFALCGYWYNCVI